MGDSMMKNLLVKWNQMSLVKRIVIGIIVGVILALTVPNCRKLDFYFWFFICRCIKGSCTNISIIYSNACHCCT